MLVSSAMFVAGGAVRYMILSWQQQLHAAVYRRWQLQQQQPLRLHMPCDDKHARPIQGNTRQQAVSRAEQVRLDMMHEVVPEGDIYFVM